MSLAEVLPGVGPDSHERAVAPEQEHDIAPGAHGGHAPDRHPGPDPAKRRAVEGLEHAGAIHHVHPFSVGTERRMQLNAPGELLDRDLTTRGGVPDPQALVAGGRQQPARVGRPSCAPDVGEAGRPGCLAAGGEVDEPESSGLGPGQGVPVRRRQREAVGGALDGRGVLPEGQLHPERGRGATPSGSHQPHRGSGRPRTRRCSTPTLRRALRSDGATAPVATSQTITLSSLEAVARRFPLVRVAAAFGQVGAAQVRAGSAQGRGIQAEDAVLAGDGDRRPVGADVEATHVPFSEAQVVGPGEQPAGVHVEGAHRGVSPSSRRRRGCRSG